MFGPCGLLVPNYEVSRRLIDLQEIIGYGHFGDVHRGIFQSGPGEQTMVAVKTCKDQSMADKFLEEACKQQISNLKKLGFIDSLSAIIQI